MKPANTYYVREFANMAGVSVRTLHYYDETGLLKPSLYTDSNHRLYRQEDMLRLQQILTLKYMGFSLEDIHNLLESDAYDVQRSLQIQKEAIDQRIEQLQQVSQALEKTLTAVTAVESLDWMQVGEIIRGVMAENKAQWAMKYYSEEQQAYLRERAQQYTPEQMQGFAHQWADLYESFAAVQSCPLDHPHVQALAARMDALLEGFTGGDAGIAASLRNVWSNPDNVPAEYRPSTDNNLQSFMMNAWEKWNENKP